MKTLSTLYADKKVIVDAARQVVLAQPQVERF